MTKIEELTELLVNEINDFNKGITKLEKINDQISTTKIRMDVTEYKSIIEKHQQKMKEMTNSQERIEDRFGSLLKNARIYPNWAVIVFIISLILCFGSLLYVSKLKIETNRLEKQNYEIEEIKTK